MLALLQMAQADPARRVSNTEPGYVAPQATARLVDGPRKAFLSAATGRKFADAADRDGRQVTLSNAYLEPAQFFFANPDAIQCKADGGLVVASRAALNAGALAVNNQGGIHIASRVMPTDHQSRAGGSDEIGVICVHEAHGSVLAVTGAKLPAWGHGQALALDGPAERATFKKMQGMCFAPNGTLFVLEEVTVRRIDRQGQVSTWVS